MLSGIERGYIPDIVDLPTPPFAEDTAMTFLTSLIGRFSGRPLCMRALKFGGVPDLGSPCGELEIADQNQASMTTHQWVLMLERPQTRKQSFLHLCKIISNVDGEKKERCKTS